MKAGPVKVATVEVAVVKADGRFGVKVDPVNPDANVNPAEGGPVEVDRAGKQIEEYFPRALLERYGDDLGAAAARAEAAVEEVISRLQQFGPEHANLPVAPGKWSPLQVADHLHRVNLIAIQGMERVKSGGEPVRTERGSIGSDGGLLMGLSGAEPEDGLTLEGVAADLRESNRALAVAAREAVASGLADVVVNVNPFFGELTPLDSLRMAALHARHHTKLHLQLE